MLCRNVNYKHCSDIGNCFKASDVLKYCDIRFNFIKINLSKYNIKDFLCNRILLLAYSVCLVERSSHFNCLAKYDNIRPFTTMFNIVLIFRNIISSTQNIL